MWFIYLLISLYLIILFYLLYYLYYNYKNNNINDRIYYNKYDDYSNANLKSLLIDGTDKNTIHSYIDVYDKLFKPLRYSSKNFLEIGVKGGQSIILWSKYFQNAHIYGLDISPKPKILNNIDKITFIKNNAYNQSTLNLFQNIKFDIMIDDGPHTLDSMIFFAKYYSQFLADNGIMIIEDVKSLDWIDKIKEVLPENLKSYSYYIDLRKNKGRFDDILFVVNKNK